MTGSDFCSAAAAAATDELEEPRALGLNAKKKYRYVLLSYLPVLGVHALDQ